MGESTGKFMVVGFVVLSCFVMIIVFFLLLYIKWFWSDSQEGTTTNIAPITVGRRRLDFPGGHREIPVGSMKSRGLEQSILESLPSVVFINKDYGERLECAICLCTVSDGEKTRILPTCNHGFHMECIDMWFHSHSTCPLCRSLVSSPAKMSDLGSRTIMEHDGDVNQTFPNNV